MVENFKYLGSNISSKLTTDPEINARIGQATGVLSKLSKRVFTNKNLTLKTKIKVYQACVLSTLLYGSETWTTYAKQETKLNVFHIRCLRKIMNISWEDKKTNTEILDKAGSTTGSAMLSTRRLRWLGHVRRMDNGRLPKDLLYGQLEQGTRLKGRPYLRYKDICKRDLQSTHINANTWEDVAADRVGWRRAVKEGVAAAEEDRKNNREAKRQRRTATANHQRTTGFACPRCSRTCLSLIGLYSHQRRCSPTHLRSPSST